MTTVSRLRENKILNSHLFDPKGVTQVPRISIMSKQRNCQQEVHRVATNIENRHEPLANALKCPLLLAHIKVRNIYKH